MSGIRLPGLLHAEHSLATAHFININIITSLAPPARVIDGKGEHFGGNMKNIQICREQQSFLLLVINTIKYHIFFLY